MIRQLLIASAATLALTAPAAADRGDRGNRGQSAKVERGGQAKANRSERRAERRVQQRVDRRAEGRAPQRAERRAERRVERRAPKRAERRAERRDDRRVALIRQARAEERRENRVERRADRQRVERRENRTERRVERRDDRRDQRFERRDNRIERRAERIDRRIDNRFDRRERTRDRDDRRLMFAGRGDDRRMVRVRDWDRDDRWVANFARGVGGCPPGLANKNPLCMPPGQYKKVVGNRLPDAYRASYVPNFLRDFYRDDDDHYYRWNDGLVYRVNRSNDLISSLIPLFGGGLLVGQSFPSMYDDYYVPSYYQPFYQDSYDDYYRYNNGYVYEIDRRSGLIEDIIPLYDRGYGIGQMLPTSYSYYNLPYQYRSYYRDDDDYYYRYAPGAIYQVDRDTQLISAIVSLLTGTPNSLAVGQQLPMGYDVYNVPYAYRSQYYDTPDSWYRYNNGYIYQVDPTTRLITAAIDAIV